MSLLEKIKGYAGVAAQTAESVGQSAAKQGKKLAATGRVKLAISAEEDKMKKAYTELGRLLYRDYTSGTEAVMDEYQPWCDKVADAQAQIARLNEELEKIHAEEPETVEAEEAVEVTDEVPVVEEEFLEETEEAPVAEPEIPEEPPVDTLYVDVTNPEE